MVTIYIQDKPLFLTNNALSQVKEYLHREDVIYKDELSAAAVDKMLKEIEKEQFVAGVFQHKDVDELLSAFKDQLKVIRAAGGLVYTPQKELLFIFRKGKWDLPKGKLDDGEDLETCAIREIEEETGAKNLTIDQPLLITYHTYYQKQKHILKESHWYLVKSKERNVLQPQTEEDITECIWVNKSDLDEYKSNTHGSILKVLEKGLAVL